MSSNRITGLASGFDTTSIVESLMKLEKQPYEKLDIKKQTEQLKLQAYQAVNTYLLKFRNSVSGLSSSKLWNSKACVSTNEKSITATANEYAVKGTYSFKVAQLATATQYMSKGFANSKSPFVNLAEGEPNKKLGTINLSSAKSRVDNSAKLESLNGGKGIFRGSVRVTDRSNNTAIVDLSSCDSMDDVVRTLSEATGVQITASIKDGKLYVQDESGGTGTMKIQNVGTGTTATDLGIAGASAAGDNFIHGRNVYVLGDEMSLKELNDGLGVEEGKFALRVSGPSSYLDLIVDVNGCSSVGDVVKRVNSAMQNAIDEDYVDPYGGGKAEDLLDGLNFGISSDKRSFSLTGVKANHSYLFYDGDDGTVSNQQPAEQLGLHGQLRTAGMGDVELTFGKVLGDVNSPMLKNLSGAGSGGVGEATVIPTRFSKDTLLSDLHRGKGLDISRPMQIQLWEGVKDGAAGTKPRVFEDIFSPNDLQDLMDGNKAGFNSGPGGKPTVEDLKNYMNTVLEEYAKDPANNAAGLTGMRVEIDEYNSRMYITGGQAGYTVEIGGTMAGGLGLSRASGSEHAPAMQVSEDDPNYDNIMNALKAFYAEDGSGASLVGANNAFNMDSSKGALTTLADLADWHGFDPSDTANIDAFINSTLGGSIQMKYTDENDVDHTVNVNLTGLGLDHTTDIQTFLDAVNGRIQDSFDAHTGYTGVPGQPRMSAPKLSVHNLQDRFQWSNVDTSKGWDMSGGMLAGLNLDKSLTRLDTLDPNAIYFDMNPGITGTATLKDIDNTTKLSDVNFGLGITLAGEPDDTLDIEIADGKKISIDMESLRLMVAGLGSDPTVDDYVSALNAMINTELGVHGASLDLAVENNSLVIKNITGADYLTISGNGATALKTGLPAGKIPTIETGKSYAISALNAADITAETAQGLGSLTFDIGGASVSLSTSGITDEHTLADLIDKLNSELDSLVGTHPELADVRFTVNDSGTGLAIANDSAKRITFKDAGGAQNLARDLGLIGADGAEVRVESYSFRNGSSLGRKYISRATSLSEYLGANAVPGTIQMTNAMGRTIDMDLSGCKTVGDVIDFVNSYADAGFGIYAQLNDKGDGITFIEAYPEGQVPHPDDIVGNISVKDLDGGNTAKKLGIAGTGNRDKAEYQGNSVLEGSLATTIDVMASDTLESIMYRISESGNYKTAIINDGSGSNPYRLTISSTNTGEANDFVISSDMDLFGFNQTSRGRDSKVLYGDPNSGASPVMLSSSTNSNSAAILGMTLDLKQASTEWTTITVDTDKERVKDEIKALAEAYNEMAGIISYLDAYDEETGEPGILFGDSSCRKLMDDINEIFYAIYNPDNKKIGSLNDDGKPATWTWMDIGISLTASNTNADGTGSWYTTMELDLDKLDDMVASNWDVLSTMLSNQRNASNSTLSDSARATASFNGELEDGFDVNNAINGDANRGGWGVTNGLMAKDTIANGNNEYTIWFQKPTTMTRMSIYHYDNATALKDFTVEYLDANTGEWEVLREIEGNASDANHLGLALPTSVSAIRIKADSTNASDDKFRLLDVQVFEETGLAGKLNQLTTVLGDTQSGFLAERNTEVTNSIKDLDEQMARLQERLTAKEESLWRRFTAMESAMGKLQNQSSYFTNMMSSLNTQSK